jgi:hypothetical protein
VECCECSYWIHGTCDGRTNAAVIHRDNNNNVTCFEWIREADPETLVSGNADGMSKDSHVFSQIACESHQIGRLDSHVLNSLLKQWAEQRKDGEDGFI